MRHRRSAPGLAALVLLCAAGCSARSAAPEAAAPASPAARPAAAPPAPAATGGYGVAPAHSAAEPAHGAAEHAHGAAEHAHGAGERAAPAAAAPPASAASPPPAPAAHAEPVPADQALAALVAGNLAFRTGQRSRSAQAARDEPRRREVAAGQHPIAAVLTCADSRLSPELIFDQHLGDLFVVRNAGNVAEPVAEGSLEYAVEHLGVRLIVVLGHARCGAVTAVAGAAAPLPGNLAAIQREMPGLADAARAAARADPDPAAVLDACVAGNAAAQARALLAESAVLRAAAAHGLEIIPAVYRLDTGAVAFALPVISDAAAAPAAAPPAHH